MRLIGLSILALLAIAASLYTYVFFYRPDLLPYEMYLQTAEIVERAEETIESVAPSCRPDSASLVDIPVPEPIPDTALEARSVIVPTALPATYANAPVIDDAFSGRRHLLSHVERIPAASEDEIRLSVIVGEDGEVLAALPVSGPKQFHARAFAIARHWKFKPYWRDGKPTIVRVDNLSVFIGGRERRPKDRVAFPALKDRTSLRVKLTQVPGQYSASYDVTIRGDGTVTYNGKWLVGVLGRHCAIIRPEAVDLLLAQFHRADFFRLHDEYTGSLSHAHTTVLSIAFDGYTKTVIDYIGSADGMPDIVAQLERFVLDAAGADRWIKGNEFTARSLAAERWNITANNDANRNLLNGVIAHGTAEAVRDVLALGAPIQTAWREQARRGPWWPSLVVAAERDDPAITRALLRTDARWDQAALDNALFSRARLADLGLVNELIARGAQPSLSRKKQTLLMQAAESGVPAVVARVLALPSNVRAHDEDQRTALHHVAAPFSPISLGEIPSTYADRGAVVDLLIRAGAEVDARDGLGMTPLIANWQGGENVATALIAAGADVNARDKEGGTALSNARTPGIVVLLLAAGADPLIGDGAVLRDAAGDHRFDVVRTLLRARIAWPKSALGVALYYAAAKADADLVDELTMHGADVHARAKSQRTPLMGAALSRVPDIILRVLALRPDINAVDAFGDTALHLTHDPYRERRGTNADWRRSVELLLDAGADLNLRDRYGRTLMHYCPDAEVATLLVERGAKINDRDKSGETALMRCTVLAFRWEPRLNTIQRLLELGADPHMRNNEGKSALDLARRGYGNRDVEQALERGMAAGGARP